MKRAPECLLHLAGPNESETFPEQGELLPYESTTISSRNGMASYIRSALLFPMEIPPW